MAIRLQPGKSLGSSDMVQECQLEHPAGTLCTASFCSPGVSFDMSRILRLLLCPAGSFPPQTAHSTHSKGPLFTVPTYMYLSDILKMLRTFFSCQKCVYFLTTGSSNSTDEFSEISLDVHRLLRLVLQSAFQNNRNCIKLHRDQHSLLIYCLNSDLDNPDHLITRNAIFKILM